MKILCWSYIPLELPQVTSFSISFCLWKAFIYVTTDTNRAWATTLSDTWLYTRYINHCILIPLLPLPVSGIERHLDVTCVLSFSNNGWYKNSHLLLISKKCFNACIYFWQCFFFYIKIFRSYFIYVLNAIDRSTSSKLSADYKTFQQRKKVHNICHSFFLFCFVLWFLYFVVSHSQALHLDG